MHSRVTITCLTWASLLCCSSGTSPPPRHGHWENTNALSSHISSTTSRDLVLCLCTETNQRATCVLISARSNIPVDGPPGSRHHRVSITLTFTSYWQCHLIASSQGHGQHHEAMVKGGINQSQQPHHVHPALLQLCTSSIFLPGPLSPCGSDTGRELIRGWKLPVFIPWLLSSGGWYETVLG